MRIGGIERAHHINEEATSAVWIRKESRSDFARVFFVLSRRKVGHEPRGNWDNHMARCAPGRSDHRTVMKMSRSRGASRNEMTVCQKVIGKCQ